jgi:hypothetical protein
VSRQTIVAVALTLAVVVVILVVGLLWPVAVAVTKGNRLRTPRRAESCRPSSDYIFVGEAAKVAASAVTTKVAVSGPRKPLTAVILRPEWVGQEPSHAKVRPLVPYCP